jgi:hypothetical protein
MDDLQISSSLEKNSSIGLSGFFVEAKAGLLICPLLDAVDYGLSGSVLY